MYGPPGVEDPISAVFDLSDRAAAMAPTMQRMYRYTATVVVLFLLIMIFLLFVGLASNLFFALLAIVAIVFAAVALSLLRETDRFYRGFADRHRAIKLLQDAEPAPKIPVGPTPIQRLARFLATSSPRLAGWLATHPEALRYQDQLGTTRSPLTFDLIVVAPGSSLYRWFGFGDPGFAVVARVGPDAPTMADLEQFARDLRQAGRKVPARIVRAILLRVHPVPLPEPVYDFAVGHPIPVGRDRVTLEIVSEQPNGTYDLVPHVLGVP